MVIESVRRKIDAAHHDAAVSIFRRTRSSFLTQNARSMRATGAPTLASDGKIKDTQSQEKGTASHATITDKRVWRRQLTTLLKALILPALR